MMGEIIIKYISFLLMSAAALFWLAAFSLAQYQLAFGLYLWVLLLLSLLAVNFICGILMKELYQQAQTDSLTGLHNRRYFYAKLIDLSKAKKNKEAISLVLIDVDNFKQINDIYGHAMGDKVLKQLAVILKDNTRKKDIVARWGGEEFAIIISSTSCQETYYIAERIRKIVENYCFCPEPNSFKITISIGIASLEEKLETNMLIKLADQALYQAKEKKNLVVYLV